MTGTLPAPLPVVFSQQGDQTVLHCARPTRAFLGRALREHKGQFVAELKGTFYFTLLFSRTPRRIGNDESP